MSKQKQDKNKIKEEIQEYDSTGTFYFSNNSIYVGAYKRLSTGSIFRSGFGKLTHKGINNTEIGEEYYEGQWENDMFNGKGKYQYSNGDLYIGDFKDNMHHGNGILKCADGTSYEGQFENHKFHGTGTFFDKDGIAWRGEFREGFYSSKEQAMLKEEKRILNKLKEWEEYPMKYFYKQWEEVYLKADKKTGKEQLSQFFASNENSGENILGPYIKIDEKPIDKWNDAFKLIFTSNYKVNIGRENSEMIYIDSKRILKQQFNENLSNGQVFEVTFNQNERIISMGLVYNEEVNKLLLIFFKDEVIKQKK